MRNALLHATFHNVLQMNDAQEAISVCHRERGAAVARDLIAHFLDFCGHLSSVLANELADRFSRSLAEPPSLKIRTTHSCVSGERNETGLALGNMAPSEAVLLFSQNDHGAAFRSFIGEAGQLRGIGQLLTAYSIHPQEFDGLAVAQRDRAGLVQQ